MKTLSIILALTLPVVAFAEADLEIRVNRIDMAEVAPDESGDTKATDHNSSRSNKTSHTPAAEVDDAGDGDDAEAEDGTRATDYNSSRSNKADNAVSDDDVDEDAPAEKAKR